MRILMRITPIVFGIVLLIVATRLTQARPQEEGAEYWISYVAQKSDNNQFDVVDVYRMQPNGDDLTLLFPNVIFTHRMSWSSNGTWLVFDSRHENYSGDIYRLNLDDLGEVQNIHDFRIQRLTDGTQNSTNPNTATIGSRGGFVAGNFAPAVSPNGEWIAFISNRNRNVDFELYLMRPDGDSVHRIADSVEIGRVAWSPDSEWIIFSAYPDPNDTEQTVSTSAGQPQMIGAALYKIRRDGSQQTLLTYTEGYDSLAPAWSPDGKTIAFVSDRSGWMDLYTMDANGENITLLRSARDHLNFNSYNFHGAPQWSPDGKWLAFVAYDTGVPQIYRMRVETRQVEQLTFAPTQIADPKDMMAWSALNTHALSGQQVLNSALAFATLHIANADIGKTDRMAAEAWAPAWTRGWGDIYDSSWRGDVLSGLGIILMAFGLMQFGLEWILRHRPAFIRAHAGKRFELSKYKSVIYRLNLKSAITEVTPAESQKTKE